MFKPFRKGVRGFTLIELLVVIAIIGILSSIVLASLNTARLKSRDARRVADMKQLQLALQLFFDSNNGRYPTTAEGTLILKTQAFMATIPTDPVGNVAYPYDSIPATGTPSSYHMGASLEDANNQALQSGSHTDTANVKGVTYQTLGCNGVLTSRYCYDVVP